MILIVQLYGYWHVRKQAVALALYGDYRAPARAADAAEARRLQAAFAVRVRSMHARYEHGTLFQGDAAPGALPSADGASAADGCAIKSFHMVVSKTHGSEQGGAALGALPGADGASAADGCVVKAFEGL